MKTLILSALMSLGATTSFAQKQWTLPECINYAIEHNISLKQRENTRRQNEVSLNTAKNSRLPDLNAGVSESLGFGRSLGMDNTYSKNNTSNTSFQISTSVPILTGNRIENTITAGEGVIDSTEDWGKRKLAYEINKLSEGDYILINFHADPNHIAELDRVLRINDNVQRHMIVCRSDRG